MKCITEIKKIIYNIKQDIDEQIKTEEICGGFDDTWVDEMKLKLDILKELEKIVSSYEFILEQDNK